MQLAAPAAAKEGVTVTVQVVRSSASAYIIIGYELIGTERHGHAHGLTQAVSHFQSWWRASPALAYATAYDKPLSLSLSLSLTHTHTHTRARDKQTAAKGNQTHWQT